MSDDVLQLFEEFTARYAVGERPDPRPYLDRAGAQSDRLVALIERYVEAAPRRTPSPDEVAVLENWLERGEPTLVALRARKGLKREAVVDALVAALQVASEKRERLAGYYHQLESGFLDSSRVDARVFAAIAKLFGVSPAELIALPARPLVPEQVYFRRTALAAGETAVSMELRSSDLTVPAAAPSARPAPAGRDELDELFLGPAG